MNEEEIELWYEEEKQQLSERYIKSIESGVSVEAREKKFNKAMEKLTKEYNSRHTSLMIKKDAEKRRKQNNAIVFKPFLAIGHLFILVSRGVSGFFMKMFRSSTASIAFHSSIIWIRNGYKLTDNLNSAFRPFYFFYVKHIQRAVLAVTNPFVKTGRWTKKRFVSAKEATATAFKSSLKSSIKAAQKVAKHAVSLAKNLSDKQEAYSKRYQEWTAKRVQEHLDKKQKLKEERENRRKEKEGIKEQKLKEGETAKHIGEAPDAELAA